MDRRWADPYFYLSIMFKGLSREVQEVIFEEIGQEAIQQAAMNINGTGGPSQIDAEVWRHVLCSKRFGKISSDFASEIATATRRLCVEEVPHSYLSLLIGTAQERGQWSASNWSGRVSSQNHGS